MNFISKLRKLIGFEEVYTLAWRKREDENDFLLNGIKEFNIYDDISDYWYADPMLLQNSEKNVIFYEMFNRHTLRGGIGFSYILPDMNLSKPKLIIDEPFHMSFPFVFELDNRIFMLPETSASGKLIFYECEQFPNKWRRHTELGGYHNLVDTIIVKNGKKLLLVSSKLQQDDLLKSSLEIFELNLVDNDFVLIKPSDFNISKNEATYEKRNAGPFFVCEKSLIRPAQISTQFQYGMALKFNKVDAIADNAYIEHDYNGVEYGSKSIILNNNEYSLTGVHTYSINSNYELIDIKFEVWNPLKWVRRIKNLISRRFKGKNG